MRDPIKFTTFVLGSFVFVYYLTLGVHATRIWRRAGTFPIPAFTEGGLGNVLHAAAGLLGPLPILAWSWNPAFFRFLAMPRIDGWPLRMVGLLALCTSLSIGSVALLELGDEWRMGVEHRREPTLVNSGIYGSIRHPLYSAIMLGLFGVWLVSANALFAGMFFVSIVSLAILARREETFLSARLGRSYADYARTTGRFWP